MGTTYPTAVDTFTNPAGTDDLSDSIGGRTHSGFHADLNDAMEAVQTKLGTDTGQASLAPGSAAAPGWTFVGDLDTGIYRVGANELGISTGGTLRATVNSTGLTVVGSLVTGSGGIVGQVYTSDAATGTDKAGSGNVGNQVTAVGYRAGKNQTGQGGTFFGNEAGNGVTAASNTAVGYLAGYLSGAASATFLGYAAGHNGGSGVAFAGTTAIGAFALPTANNQLAVGGPAVPVYTWVPGHDPDTYLDFGTADTVKHYAGGVKVLELNETGAAPLMGFFGTAAVAKPTGVAVSAAGIHAALVTLGLIAA